MALLSAAFSYAFVCIFHLLTNKQEEKKLILLAACCDINKNNRYIHRFWTFYSHCCKKAILIYNHGVLQNI